MASPRYINSSDLLRKIPDDVQALLTDDGTTLNKDSSILDDAILEAENEAESYLAQRYSLPVEAEDGTHPEKLISVIVVLAKYALFQRRDAVNEVIQVQYDSAIAWLDKLARGVISLPILDSSDNVESDGVFQIDVSDQSNDEFDVFV